MSGMWRDVGNHDLSELYDTVYGQYPKDFVQGVYRGTSSHWTTPVWFLKFESGWQIGKFDTLEEAIKYALAKYSEHIRMI